MSDNLSSVSALREALERLPDGPDVVRMFAKLGLWTSELHRNSLERKALPSEFSKLSPQELSDLSARVVSDAGRVLELVGLEEKGDRKPSELSGGEQQRVAIARAYVSRPTILIADEPTGNLDPATSVGIMKLLDRINREGTTVVMATHDAGIVDQMRKRVIELEGGHVIRDQARGVYGYTG